MSPEEFVARASWRFAKTMAEIPHEYTTRGEILGEEEFEAFVSYIREYGYRGRFRRSTYTYFNLGGWKYWTMGWPVHKTIVINRARLDGEVQGTLPHGP